MPPGRVALGTVGVSVTRQMPRKRCRLPLSANDPQPPASTALGFFTPSSAPPACGCCCEKLFGDILLCSGCNQRIHAICSHWVKCFKCVCRFCDSPPGDVMCHARCASIRFLLCCVVVLFPCHTTLKWYVIAKPSERGGGISRRQDLARYRHGHMHSHTLSLVLYGYCIDAHLLCLNTSASNKFYKGGWKTQMSSHKVPPCMHACMHSSTLNEFAEALACSCIHSNLSCVQTFAINKEPRVPKWRKRHKILACMHACLCIRHSFRAQTC